MSLKVGDVVMYVTPSPSLLVPIPSGSLALVLKVNHDCRYFDILWLDKCIREINTGENWTTWYFRKIDKIDLQIQAYCAIAKVYNDRHKTI